MLRIDCLEDDSIEITADYVPERNTKPIDAFLANIYETDIVTQLDGKIVPLYNMGGETLILIDSFDTYGDVVWYPEERKIYFTYVPYWKLELPNDYKSDTSSNISDFTLELTRAETGEFVIGGENAQYITFVFFSVGKGNMNFQFSLYQNVNLQTEGLSKLLGKMLNNDRGEWITDNVEFANEHMKIVINREQIPIISVTGGGGNAHSNYLFYVG